MVPGILSGPGADKASSFCVYESVEFGCSQCINYSFFILFHAFSIVTRMTLRYFETEWPKNFIEFLATQGLVELPWCPIPS